MGLKHCRDLLRNCGLCRDGICRAYKPKCHWDAVEASEDLGHLCPTSLSVQKGGGGKGVGRGGRQHRKPLSLDDLCLVTIVMDPV